MTLSYKIGGINIEGNCWLDEFKNHTKVFFPAFFPGRFKDNTTGFRIIKLNKP